MDFFNIFKEEYEQIPPLNLSEIIEDYDIETLKKMFSCIDLTSLNTDDNETKIENLCEKVKNFQTHFPDMPNVAAVCVDEKFAPVLKKYFEDTEIKRAVVTAGFPGYDMPMTEKAKNAETAALQGANELDFVLNLDYFFNNSYETVSNEIVAIKNSTFECPAIKVILETGVLKTHENIWKASLLAMKSEAHFIKTSTGKTEISATPEAVWIMAHAIKAFMKSDMSLYKVGIKPSGGIVTVKDAIIYWSIVKHVLGDKWLNSSLFRFGASRLANNILTEIEKLKGSDRIITCF